MFQTIQEVNQYLEEYSKKNCSSSCLTAKHDSCTHCMIAVLERIIHKGLESEKTILEMANNTLR